MHKNLVSNAWRYSDQKYWWTRECILFVALAVVAMAMACTQFWYSAEQNKTTRAADIIADFLWLAIQKYGIFVSDIWVVILNTNRYVIHYVWDSDESKFSSDFIKE